MAKKVFIGVGHGGKDSGATGNGFKEKDLNLSIALACRDELIKNGVSVLMSRTKDENDPLTDEIKECNNFNPDLALDIHNNAGGGDGAEVFHYSNGGTSKTLAQNILNEIVKIGQNSRGLKIKKNIFGKDYFGFIREIKAPSVIVECAFVDNKNDIKIIDTETERKKMGIAIAYGILKTLGIAGKATPIKTKSVEEVAKEVIQGKWGNGTDRKNRLTKAGYDYAEVQAKVNELISGKAKPKLKSVEEVAKEVIKGKWGNGTDRKNRLTQAGYNYTEVQKKVNQLLK